MREIKFRQPIFEKGRFIKFHYWGTLDNGLSFVAPITGRSDDIRRSQEYISLKDKNNKEIYKGDIVKSFYRNDKGSTDGEVIYLTQSGRYGVRSGYRLLEFGKRGRSFEIIGNIYQNKELLK